MKKWSILFCLSLAIITTECYFSNEELIKKMELVNNENRLIWKLIYLQQSLTEEEQIAALDSAIEIEALASNDLKMQKALNASRELTSGERIATLGYLWPSQQKQVAALTEKLLKKIDQTGLKES